MTQFKEVKKPLVRVQAPKMLSGFGQFHSNEITAKVKREYSSIDLESIRSQVDSPSTCPKGDAQWLIPSTFASRVFKTQEANGQYWMLWADLDREPLPIEKINDALKAIGNFDFEIYTSKSATVTVQKARVLIPLSKAIAAQQWRYCQEILNDYLKGLGAIPDTANVGCAQLCYLPNRGDFYDSRSNRNNYFLDPESAWAMAIEERVKAAKNASERLDFERRKAQEQKMRVSGYQHSNLIGAFNDAYTVTDVLIWAGYEQRGKSFRHPGSESGSFSATVKNKRVNTLSSNDPLYTGGAGAHDAFSAFMVLFAGGDQSEALKIAHYQLLKIGGDL